MICSKCFEKLTEQIGIVKIDVCGRQFSFHTKCAPEPDKIRSAQINEEESKPQAPEQQ